MDVGERNVQDRDEQLVCQWIHEATERRRLIGKVPSYQSIELTSFTTVKTYNLSCQ